MNSLPTVTNSNYYSPDSAQIYMGATQFKEFLSCPARAMARLRGEVPDEKTTALLVGSYVDSHFAGSLDVFRAKNPEIYKRDGSLKAEYEQANYIIRRIERDPLMMEYCSGETQRIMTGSIDGVPVKTRMDFYVPGQRIVDMKIMRSLEDVWVEGEGKRRFITAWGYDIQAAFYQEIERQSRGIDAEPLPFFIAAATKEKPEPDMDVIEIAQDVIDAAMMLIQNEIAYFDEIKQGMHEPDRCEKCNYCRSTRVLKAPTVFSLTSAEDYVF